jgi:hypothetical protein
VDDTVSGPCQMASFNIRGVEHSGSATSMLLTYCSFCHSFRLRKYVFTDTET